MYLNYYLHKIESFLMPQARNSHLVEVSLTDKSNLSILVFVAVELFMLNGVSSMLKQFLPKTINRLNKWKINLDLTFAYVPRSAIILNFLRDVKPDRLLSWTLVRMSCQIYYLIIFIQKEAKLMLKMMENLEAGIIGFITNYAFLTQLMCISH